MTRDELLAHTEKLERGARASGPRQETPRRHCPICATPLKGRQRSACSNRCLVALHRRRQREAEAPSASEGKT